MLAVSHRGCTQTAQRLILPSPRFPATRAECNVTQRVGLTQIDSDNELLVTIAEGTTVPEAFDLTIVDSSVKSFVRVHRGGRRVFEEDVVQQIRARHTAAERASHQTERGGRFAVLAENEDNGH